MTADPVTEVLKATEPNLSLTVHVTRLDLTRLELSYVAKNTGPHGIWLLNRLDQYQDAKGIGRFLDPNLVYVKLLEDPSAIVLFKGVCEFPLNTSFEIRWVPCLTQLEPGQECAEKMLVTLPLRPRTWYEQEPDRELVKTQVEWPTYFELGYKVLTHPDARKHVFEVRTNLGPAPSVEPVTPGSQLVIRTPEFPFKLPVLRPKWMAAGE
jgi:hypothetical protein